MYIHVLMYRVIFTNNYIFGSSTNYQLAMKFAKLQNGLRIVSTREFCPLNFRLNDRNQNGMLYNNNMYHVMILMRVLRSYNFMVTILMILRHNTVVHVQCFIYYSSLR